MCDTLQQCDTLRQCVIHCDNVWYTETMCDTLRQCDTLHWLAVLPHIIFTLALGTCYCMQGQWYYTWTMSLSPFTLLQFADCSPQIMATWSLHGHVLHIKDRKVSLIHAHPCQLCIMIFCLNWETVIVVGRSSKLVSIWACTLVAGAFDNFVEGQLY